MTAESIQGKYIYSPTLYRGWQKETFGMRGSEDQRKASILVLRNLQKESSQKYKLIRKIRLSFLNFPLKKFV